MFNAQIRTNPHGWSVILPTTGFTLNMTHVKEGFKVIGTRTRSNGNSHDGSDTGNGYPARRAHRKSLLASPGTSKARRDQGRYLNALRPLTKANRNRIRKIREAKGVVTAIREARKMAS